MLPWGGSDLMEQPAFVYQAIDRCEVAFAAVQGQQSRAMADKIEKLNEER